ncbi:MAG TPA: glycosyltransferase family 4 protein [Pyrinomonadaceae bacterium]|nr:glycosyltransferase family 4 protein [Pyrinomonadaceae bacterium]
MKVLLLNQCFYPDVMATAQYLTDLAVGLVEEGHDVTVVTSDRGYDNPSQRFPRRETWRGIKIIRISSLALGKETRWRRAANFASFLLNCTLRLLLLSRFDVVVGLTSPPLISFLGALFVRIKGGRFFFWVMDLNPDEAIAAGWLKDHSVSSRILKGLLRYSLVNAEGVIALDRFVKQRVVAKGVPETSVSVLPPWGLDDSVTFDMKGREAFRRQHNLKEKFVVMYAGNHSPCHPLDTLVEAARRLADNKEIVFCFVGGGSEQKRVADFARRHGLENILCLPYQPFATLSASLSAADLHTVVMGDKMVGIIHPCKIYNILSIGCSFLYIGPTPSHVTEITAAIGSTLNSNRQAYSARTGDVETVVQNILEQAKRKLEGEQDFAPEMAGMFSRQTLLPRMIKILESRTADTALFAQSESSSYMSAER